jgi:phosphoribosyl-dephospho-CoA transferase
MGFMGIERLATKREHDGFPSVRMLAQAKKLALRRRVWFNLLNRVERGIIDLTVKYVGSIKSRTLAKVVAAIMNKLQFAVETMVERLVRTVGLPLARKNSEIAVSWGNCLASMWADDLAFARFLVVSFGKE